MKKSAFLLLLLLLGVTCLGQKGKKDFIYLKNGSTLKGQKVNLDSNNVLIKSGKNFWVIKNSEIDTIIDKQFRQTGFVYQSRPYFVKTSFGVLVGNADNEKDAPFVFDASFNYNFFRKFYAGLGAGVDLLEDSYLPAFINFEYHFREERISPFASLRAGYMIPLDDKIKTQTYYDIMPWSSVWPYSYQETLYNHGGIMLNPSFGFINQLTDNLDLMLSFGYQFHQVTFKGKDHYELEKNYNRLTLRLGIIFN